MRVNPVDRVFTILQYIILVSFAMVCILPLLLILSASITDEARLLSSGYSLFPGKPSFAAYQAIFQAPDALVRAYLVTILASCLGTLFGTLLTSTIAFAMARKDYIWSKATTAYVFITILFSGGLVPWYILVSRTLGMRNTIFALFVPYLVVPWFALLMKGFFQTLPLEVIESAKLDGAGEGTLFFRIVVPMSKPAFATLALFYLLLFWNDYWLSLLFMDRQEMVSLQFLLFRIMSNIDFLNSSLGRMAGNSMLTVLPSQSTRMAICVLAAGPVLFIFPFFQKYFVKGITIGSVKG